MTALAAGFGISRATGYRYRDEVVTVLSAQAPDLHEALQRVADEGWSHTLLRLEPAGSVAHDQYLRAYRRMREAVDDHLNPHFNMIDRAVQGPHARRDAETIALLAQTAARPLRHVTMDSRGQHKACGSNRACRPLPVADRVSTDFLWQRDPFTLFREGESGYRSEPFFGRVVGQIEDTFIVAHTAAAGTLPGGTAPGWPTWCCRT